MGLVGHPGAGAGLAGLSIDEIAVRAEVSCATLYRMFADKSALFDGLVQHFSPWQPISDLLAAASDRHPHELIPLIAESIAATLSGRADLLLRIVLELTSADPNTVAARHPALGRGTGSRPSSQN